MTAGVETCDTVIIGAGSIGIAVAYYLTIRHGVTRLVLIDAADPMALTSAQSGENYRNWWPHPVMTAYTNYSIDLLEDVARASGDLDGQTLAWTEEERGLLAADPKTAALLEPMPSGVHCRPEGGDGGRWIKVGWAYNQSSSDPEAEPPLDPHYPDIVLRAASRLNPSLRAYLGRLPRGPRHYGGHYTMTAENWPLIGPMRTSGAFVAGALSGFGTMAACSTGALCAAWIAGGDLPAYACALSPGRYADNALMAELRAANRGIL